MTPPPQQSASLILVQTKNLRIARVGRSIRGRSQEDFQKQSSKIRTQFQTGKKKNSVFNSAARTKCTNQEYHITNYEDGNQPF